MLLIKTSCLQYDQIFLVVIVEHIPCHGVLWQIFSMRLRKGKIHYFQYEQQWQRFFAEVSSHDSFFRMKAGFVLSERIIMIEFVIRGGGNATVPPGRPVIGAVAKVAALVFGGANDSKGES